MQRATHRRARRRLDAFLDGELPAPQAGGVGAHLAECWQGAGAADELRVVRRSLRRLAARRTLLLASARLRRAAGVLAGGAAGARGATGPARTRGSAVDPGGRGGGSAFGRSPRSDEGRTRR